MEIIIEDRLILCIRDIQKLGKEVYLSLKQLVTYKNPKFIENEKWGYFNGETPKELYSYSIEAGKIYISRGALDRVIAHFKKFHVGVKLIDRTLVCETANFNQSNTILRPDQKIFVKKMKENDYGSGVAYTSFGKTIALLELAREIGQPTLVIVHTTFLQDQWIKEATNPALFNLDMKDIGGVGGKFAGKKRKYGKLNVCLYHSLAKQEHLDFFKDRIGLVMFDEGQKSPIDGVQKVVNNFRARYRYTASAGLRRKDGKEFLTFDTFGPIRYRVIEEASDSKVLADIKLVGTRYEDDDYAEDGNYVNMITRMSLNKERNILIAKRVVKHIKDGKFVLVFVERKAQAVLLRKYLGKFKGDMLLGATNWQDFSVPHLIQSFAKKGKEVPESKMLQATALGSKTLKILKDYDDKTAYDRISELAEKKELDYVIGTQKAEVGLSVRTFDLGITTTPTGKNLERFNQILGRLERTWSAMQMKLFKGIKPTPVLEVLVDKGIRPSRDAAVNIKEQYNKRVITNKKRGRK